MRGEYFYVNSIGEPKGKTSSCLREEDDEGVEEDLVGAVYEQTQGQGGETGE